MDQETHTEQAQAQHLSRMYQSWFLDYASYVILERAVPHIGDGLKPVQRRILHTMKRLDDGRYNKVANIVGHAMQFHPHGDASIKDALVQLGQKDLLIDCQGNWGNVITGDDAAAARYIEARLSKFALEVAFNAKTTDWKLSYDGRNCEPIALPVKFPLLLAQGADGIAVGLNCKILPHNFCELCDAAVSHLRGEPFLLLPDFPTGGSIDAGKYNDGQRGGSVRVRAKIEKRDARTLAITEIPYGKTTGTASKPSSFVESILKAAEKGKIKVRKVEDLTASKAEILIHLAPGVSGDKTIDALYACTDCEVSISPNCCVIDHNKPRFLSVSDVLRASADATLELLRRERLIHKAELTESLHYASLERIFIEERIYKDKGFEEAASNEEACRWIEQRLEPWKDKLIRPVTQDDLMRLLDTKMQRILRFNKDKAEQQIAQIKADIKRIDHELAHMTDVTADWFLSLKAKYGAQHPRLTEVKSFDNISAAKVVEANQKLYINRAEGFIGTALKKDEFVCNCSDIDDLIIFYRDGTYKLTHVAEKLFVGETERSKAEKRKAEIVHLAVFKRGDTRTVYNAIYADGKDGHTYIKRFTVTGLVRDRESDLTQGKPYSRLLYFSANPNGEAEVVRVTLKPQLRLRKITSDKDFSTIAIKSRLAKGNLLSKEPVARITLKSRGASTLGGRQVWFDADIKRLNYDAIGQYLGEFNPDERILVMLPTGECFTTSFDVNNHYDDTLLRIEKADPDKVWTACLIDASQGSHPYLKRFTLAEASARRQQWLSDNPDSRLLLLTDTPSPRLLVTFADEGREPLELDAESFVAVKGFKAKGKRITTLHVASVEELPQDPPPEHDEPEEPEPDEPEPEEEARDAHGQLSLFD